MDKQALIDKAVKNHNGLFPGNDSLGDGYYFTSNGSLGHLEFSGLVTQASFENRAKELGFLNGFEWGKEYPTNGKKPDLPGDVEVERKFTYGWSSDPYLMRDLTADWNHAIAFRITDLRYKPKQPESHSNPVKDKADVLFALSDAMDVATDAGMLDISRSISAICKVVKGEEMPSVDNLWHDKGELPPIGVECEVYGALGQYNEWHKCEIFAVEFGRVFIKNDKGFTDRSITNIRFRPIKTEKDKFVEAAVEIMTKSDEEFAGDLSMDAENVTPMAKALFDAGCRFVSQESIS